MISKDVFARKARYGPTQVALAAVFLLIGSAAANNQEALDLVARIEKRLAQCNDYQYLVNCFERRGERQERRCYRLSAKGDCLVRIKILSGRGAGSEATRDASGRIRARKGGLLKSFPKTLQPNDRRICSLRGTPFWEATAHHFLHTLRESLTQPGSQCKLGPDSDTPGLRCLRLDRPGSVQQRVWIDPQQMHVVRNELYENGVLVESFSIQDVRENVGLKDGFFSF